MAAYGAHQLGRIIKARRQQKDWTLGQLAMYSGVAKSYLSRIERGQHENVSAKTLSQIARALDFSVDYLCIQAGYLPPVDEVKNLSPRERELLNIIHSVVTPGFRVRLVEIIVDFATAARNADLARQPEQLRLMAEKVEEYEEKEE